MDDQDQITLTIHHHSKPHLITLPTTATLTDLTNALSATFQIPPENQKLLISPKPGMLKPPFASTPLSTLLPSSETKTKTKITLLGTPPQEINDLNTQVADTKRRIEARAATRTANSHHLSTRTRSTPSGIHTLSTSANANDSNYTFHRLEPLHHLPNPARSLSFLARLRDDPGIRHAMIKHRFSVPLLTEMDPIEHTTMESRTLGLNRNKGEVIELRLRTDAYDGYRDYRTIRKTLCHELAHCVFSEHDRDFWDLTKQIEREVERADWKSGGRVVGSSAGPGGRVVEEFYNPGDWEGSRGEDMVVDEKGWVGSAQVLGGSVASTTTVSGGDMREVRARAAEERLKRAKEERREEE